MSDASETVARGLYGLLKITAATIIALGIVGGAIWGASRIFLDTYVDARITSAQAPLVAAVEALTTHILDVQSDLAGLGSRPYIEFNGNPIVRGVGPFLPGGTVPLLASLRRLVPCSTTVQVRFLNQSGVIDTSLTYEIPATQSPVVTQFIAFPLNISLPENMPEGYWSYAPLLIPEPDSCPTFQHIVVPPSEYFEVRRGNSTD